MSQIWPERHKEQPDAEEQAAFEKEQWIDDEAYRLLSFFPEQLNSFRHWNVHPEVKKCCACNGADDAYRDFILRLAYLQAERNYDLQVVSGREEPALSGYGQCPAQPASGAGCVRQDMCCGAGVQPAHNGGHGE